MIEAPIITALRADSALAALVSTYEGAPAIFSEEAPEKAAEPYITIRVLRSAEDDLVIQSMTLYVDYWDYQKSRVNTRAAVERIEFVLDDKSFESDRFSDIRCWYFSDGEVNDDQDARAIHHNVQFMVRATRKKWIQQINN